MQANNLVVSILPVLSVAAAAAPAAAQQWFRAPELAAADREFLAVADINADGVADILAQNGLDYEVLLGVAGSGAFVPGVSFPRPAGISGYVLLEDVDADGFVDLVYTYNTFPGGGFAVMPGQPGGTFASPILMPMQEVPSRLVSGDCNGDGIPDVAFTGFDGTVWQETVRWVLGDANRQFSALPQFYVPPGSDLKSIVALDSNGDGFDDVAVSARGVTHVILTQGSTLVPGPSVAVPGSFSHWIDAGDLDGDLDDDLVAVSQDGTGIFLTVMENSAGTFLPSSVAHGGMGTGQPHIGDWDVDGDADVVLRAFGGGFALFENSGALQPDLILRELQNLPFTLVGPGLHDVNQDGHPDLVTAHYIRPGPGSEVLPAADGPLVGIPIVDVEGDGDPDASDGLRLLTNDGRGVFRTQPNNLPTLPPGQFYSGSVASADFDGDGLREALVSLFSSSSPYQFGFVEMRRLEEDGGGNLVDLGACAPPGQRILGPVFVTDSDGDGALDIVGRDRVWSNSGSHVFHAEPSTFANYRPLEPVDINGDGELDFLAGLDGNTSSLAILRHTGGHTYAVDIITPATPFVSQHAPVLADVDDDGDMDVVTHSTSGPEVMQFYLNQGGTFSPGPLYPIAGAGSDNFSSYLAADVDVDGRTDLVYALSERIYVLRRNGPGLTYDDPAVYLISQAHEFADVDQDGDPDLVARSVVFNRHFDGAGAGQHRQFGAPGVGSGNRSPVLGCSGSIRAGETPVLRLRQAAGASLTVMTMGYQESSLASPVVPGLVHYGYPFVVTLWLTTTGSTGQAGLGGHDLPVPIPAGLAGAMFYFQHHVFDAGASNVVVHSNGLEFTVGG